MQVEKAVVKYCVFRIQGKNVSTETEARANHQQKICGCDRQSGFETADKSD